MRQVLDVLAAKRTRDDKRKLWAHYMGNLVTVWGSKNTFADVLAEYERARNVDEREEIERAHSTADDVLRQLEESRKEGKEWHRKL